MDGPQVLAEAVKNARYELRLRQEDVEARGGPSVATLRNIESGKIQAPRPRTLRALDDSLRWVPGTAAALFEGRAAEPVPAEDARAVVPERGPLEVDDLIAAVARLPLGDLKRLRDIVATAIAVRSSDED